MSAASTSRSAATRGSTTNVALKRRIAAENPALAERIAFVLCGKGDDDDQDEMKAEGLTVFANVSDRELIDLYVAADLYANFSKWEGFNLGIAQGAGDGASGDRVRYRGTPPVRHRDQRRRGGAAATGVRRGSPTTDRPSGARC